MYSSKPELIETLGLIKEVPILVVGDLILDRYIWGKVTRISPEAPVPVVEVRKTEDRLGGAANAALNLRGVSAEVVMCGYIGDDEEGVVLKSLLEKSGISTAGILVDPDRPTALKTRVIAHHQQVVRIDREDASEHAKTIRQTFAKIVNKQLPDARAVILSDYGKGVVSPELINVFEKAKSTSAISLSKKPLVLDPHPANYGIYGSMSVAKPNRREAELATGIKIVNKETAIDAAKMLLHLWQADMMLITLGEDGLVLAFANESPPILLETRAKHVFDVSGAGDTVTALFAAAIAAGARPGVAGDLANIGAGIVVSEIGTVAVDAAKLTKEINEIP